MLLPTVAGAGPLPSPELRVSSPADSPVLAPWTVTGLSLKPAVALSWLATLPATPGEFYHGYGADLRFWSTAAKLVLELLVRGRFLPTVAPELAAARWQLLLAEAADQERVQALAAPAPNLLLGAGELGSPGRARNLVPLVESPVSVLTIRFRR